MSSLAASSRKMRSLSLFMCTFFKSAPLLRFKQRCTRPACRMHVDQAWLLQVASSVEDINNHCIAFCKEFKVEVLQSAKARVRATCVISHTCCCMPAFMPRSNCAVMSLVTFVNMRISINKRLSQNKSQESSGEHLANQRFCQCPAFFHL